MRHARIQKQGKFITLLTPIQLNLCRKSASALESVEEYYGKLVECFSCSNTDTGLLPLPGLGDSAVFL